MEVGINEKKGGFYVNKKLIRTKFENDVLYVFIDDIYDYLLLSREFANLWKSIEETINELNDLEKKIKVLASKIKFLKRKTIIETGVIIGHLKRVKLRSVECTFLNRDGIYYIPVNEVSKLLNASYNKYSYLVNRKTTYKGEDFICAFDVVRYGWRINKLKKEEKIFDYIELIISLPNKFKNGDIQVYASSICKYGYNIEYANYNGKMYWDAVKLYEIYGDAYDSEKLTGIEVFMHFLSYFDGVILYNHKIWIMCLYLNTERWFSDFAKDYFEMVYKQIGLNPCVGRDEYLDRFVKHLFRDELNCYVVECNKIYEGDEDMDGTVYLDSNGQEIDMNEEVGVCPKNEEFNNVNHPEHYLTGGMEVIDILKAKLTPEEFKGFCKGNSLKYLFRAEHKGKEKEDYEKAKWYLERLIENV